jgi:erythromycin esterase
MMRALLPALVLAVVVGACSFNDIPGFQQPPGFPIDTTTPPPPRSLQTWVDTNSVTVRSVAFDDADFTDLRAFGDAVGNARLVLLGEQSGGDGTTVRAKARLVRYLHEQRGFDVLIFESQLFEMASAWQAVRDGGAPVASLRSALPAPTRDAAELEPLLRYVGERAATSRPLHVAGLHPEFRGTREIGPRSRFVEALRAYLAANDSEVLATARWDALVPRLHELVNDETASLAWTDGERTAVAEGLQLLWQETNRLVNSVPEAESGFWVTVVGALESAARVRDALVARNPDEAAARRDSAMSDALVWLAQAAYPGHKLLVWTSSERNVRTPRELFTLSNAQAGHERPVLGELIRTALGDVVYSLAFLAGSGSYGPVSGGAGPPLRTLISPLPESWDGLLLATGKPHAFLHLRRPVTEEDVWIYGSRVARPMQYQQLQARWPFVYDGFFFSATMTPLTALP